MVARMKRALIASALALVALVAPGCTNLQRPFVFVTPAVPDGLQRVVRTLASQGWLVARQDPASGVVATRWRSTGFRYGFVADGRPAVIVQRMVVVVTPGPGQSTVTVRTDLQKCVEGGVSVGTVEIREGCERLDGVLGQHQSDVDLMGHQLRAAFAQGG
jgi:hypothetical protein